MGPQFSICFWRISIILGSGIAGFNCTCISIEVIRCKNSKETPEWETFQYRYPLIDLLKWDCALPTNAWSSLQINFHANIDNRDGEILAHSFVRNCCCCCCNSRLAGDRKNNWGIDYIWNLHRVTQFCL